MLVIAVDPLAVKMTFILRGTNNLIVLMDGVVQTDYHRKHQAH